MSVDIKAHESSMWRGLLDYRKLFCNTENARCVSVEGTTLDIENGVDLVYFPVDEDESFKISVRDRVKNPVLTYVDLKVSSFVDFIPLKLIDHISIADPMKPHFKHELVKVALESWITGYQVDVYRGVVFDRDLFTDYWIVGNKSEDGFYRPNSIHEFQTVKSLMISEGPKWIELAMSGSPNHKLIATTKSPKSATVVLYVHKDKFKHESLLTTVSSQRFKLHILNNQRDRLI